MNDENNQMNQFYNNQTNYSNADMNFQNNNVENEITEEELLNAYIGKNINKLKDGRFSLNTLLLGSVYVLYRKMWLLGFFWSLFSLIITILVPKFFVATLLLNVIIAIIFKEVYINTAKDNIKKILDTHKGESKQELINACSKKGGTALWIAITIVIIYVMGIVTAISIIFGTMNDTQLSVGITEVALKASEINDYCAVEDMKEQLTGKNGICHDGLTIEEASKFFEGSDAELLQITYNKSISKMIIKIGNVYYIYDNGQITYSKEKPIINNESIPNDDKDISQDNEDIEEKYIQSIFTLTKGNDTTSKWYYINSNKQKNTITLLKIDSIGKVQYHEQCYDRGICPPDGCMDTMICPIEYNYMYEESSVKTYIDNYGVSLGLNDELKSVGLINLTQLENMGCILEETSLECPTWITDVLNDSWTSFQYIVPGSGSPIQTFINGESDGVSVIEKMETHPVIEVSNSIVKCVENCK